MTDEEYKESAMEAAIEALCICHPYSKTWMTTDCSVELAEFFFDSGYEAAELRRED